MKIQSLQGFKPVLTYSSDYNKNNIYNTNSINASDKITFGTSYSGILKKLSGEDIKTLKEVRDGFDLLMSEIILSEKFEKTKAFKYIEKLYKKEGYIGLMHEMWKPHPVREVVNLMKLSADKHVVLVKDSNKPILTLYNPGSFDFSAGNNTTKAREMILCFQTPDEKIVNMFTLNEDANYMMIKRANDVTRTIEYYASTWNKKCETVDGLGPQSTTYFKKDGSKDFWKNLFRGGPAVAVF